jgi:hypothetical protein
VGLATVQRIVATAGAFGPTKAQQFISRLDEPLNLEQV